MDRLKRFLPLILLAGVIALIFGMGWNRYLSLDTLREHGAAFQALADEHYILTLLGLMLAFALLTASVVPGVVFITVTAGYLFGPWVGGVATAFAGYGRNTGDGSTMFFGENPYGAAQAPAQSMDSRDAIVGVSVPLGATTVLASYVHKDDRDAANRDARQLAIGATYALSKRSKVYVAYAHIRNRNDAAYMVGNATEVGTGNRAFNVGLRHAF